MPFISDTQLARVESKLSSIDRARDRAKRFAEEKAGMIKSTAEVVGAAAAMGFLRGKLEDSSGQWNLPGIALDVEMVVGFGLVGAAFMGVFGKYNEDALHAGNGILAAFSHGVLRRLGKTGEFQLVAGDGGLMGSLASGM